MERSAKMAPNESVYEDCLNSNNDEAATVEEDKTDAHLDLYETALEDFFADLTLNSPEELRELSRITNGDLCRRTSSDSDSSPALADDNADFYLAVQSMAITSTIEPRPRAKDFFESTSSTPKRKLQFAKPPRHVKMIAQLAELAEESLEQQCNGATATSCAQQSAQAVTCAMAAVEEKRLEAVAAATATDADLVNLSLLVREHRRELVLSPLSQKLKSAILRQERLQKRQQRIELSKKSQRVSLRV